MMRTTQLSIRLFAASLLLVIVTSGLAQTAGPAKEIWPRLSTTVELWPQTSLQVWSEKQDGEDFDFSQWKIGALVSYRMKRMAKVLQHETDEENAHNLSLGAGYEYLQTDQNKTTKRENRIFLHATTRYLPGLGLLLQDRNRVEFRWTGGDFSARYRNRLAVQRPFKANAFRFTPYASGELFYDGKRHSWNQSQYALGVQLPNKKRFMLDTYYLRQNCTTCSQDPLNVFGVTLNVYFRR